MHARLASFVLWALMIEAVRRTAGLALTIIVVIFFFLTAPVASHLIARASYTSGHKLWSQTVRDDYAESRASGPDLPLDPDDLSL